MSPMAGVPAPGGLYGRVKAERRPLSPETRDIGPVMIKQRYTVSVTVLVCLNIHLQKG